MTVYSSIINPNININDIEERRFLFEQYKLFVDGANKLADRRRDANTLYITINSLIISSMGTLAQGKVLPGNNSLLVGILLIIGVGSVMSWISIMSLYRTIDSENYAIIKEFESYFPSNVYTRFNQYVAREKGPQGTKSFLVAREMIIPYSFLLGYTVFIAYEGYRIYKGYK